MERRILVCIWAPAALLLLVLGIAAGRPFLVAWRCYEAAASGDWATAEIVGKHETVGLVLQVASGSRRGEACTLKVAEGFYAEAQTGELLDVVVRSDRPGECLRVETVEASHAFLVTFAAVCACVALGVILVALLIQRSFGARPPPTSFLDVAAPHVVCPRCGKEMAEGYVPLLAGLHWRRPGEPVGLPHALGGLPGTVGWKGRPRLHAFRCEPCEVITLRYGKQPAVHRATPDPITPATLHSR